MWRDTFVRELQGGTQIFYEGAIFTIARLLWAPRNRRDVTLEPLAGGPPIERTFFNWSIYPTRSKPCANEPNAHRAPT